jgi:DNA/RNA endonuclease YhcR with UshA esterase domain
MTHFGKSMVTLIGAAAVLVSVPVSAHHSFEAEYDRSKPVTVTGTVTKMEWMNPHIYFFIDIESEGGDLENWAVEGGAPNGLYRRGWRKDSLKAGDQVQVDGWLAKDGSNSMNSGTVLRQADGLRLFAGTSNPDDR